MELNLTLDGLNVKDRVAFCKYIIQKLVNMFTESYDKNKAEKLEKFINENNLIQWQIPQNRYITVYYIYKVALHYLTIKTLNQDTFQITFDKNLNIPASYTKLYSIIALLEYGNLSVKKYGLLSRLMKDIADNLQEYYDKYKLEAK